jgi:O-antigen ligase
VAGATATRSFFPRRRAGLSQGLLLFGLVVSALAVGALSVKRPLIAVAIVVAAAVVLLIASNIRALPPILVVTVFAEAIAVGGITVGRLMGVLALAVLVYYLLVGGHVDLKPNALLAVAVAYGFWILLSYYWAAANNGVFTTFFKWALSFAFTLAFAILVRNLEHVKAVLYAFVISAVLFGAAGFLTFLGSAGSARATGLTGDPNQFATYQALAVPAALVLAGLESRPQVRVALYGSVALAVVTIATSLSRGGLITLGVIVGVTMLVPWHVFFRRPGQKVSYLLALVFAGWVVGLLGSTQLLARIQTIFNPGQDKGSGRIDLWSAAWNAYSHHPALGLGSGGFEANSLTYLQNTPGVNIGASYVAAGRPAHNAYLEALVDLGPIGLTIFVLVLGLTLWYFARSAARFRAAGDLALQRVTLALIASLLGLSVSMFFLSIGLGKAIWIFAGLALAFDRMSAPTEARPTAGVLGRLRRARP